MTSLSAGQKKFILHWDELGTRWGLNRSIARSNVSASLRELQGWGLVRVVHVMGDRRDHFDTVPDLWEMFTIVVEERKPARSIPPSPYFVNGDR
jgi:DNA-binding transcriptional regulator GbsR (MarR family)